MLIWFICWGNLNLNFSLIRLKVCDITHKFHFLCSGFLVHICSHVFFGGVQHVRFLQTTRTAQAKDRKLESSIEWNACSILRMGRNDLQFGKWNANSTNKFVKHAFEIGTAKIFNLFNSISFILSFYLLVLSHSLSSLNSKNLHNFHALYNIIPDSTFLTDKNSIFVAKLCSAVNSRLS